MIISKHHKPSLRINLLGIMKYNYPILISWNREETQKNKKKWSSAVKFIIGFSTVTLTYYF